jgi:hypothetical protein
MFLHVKDFLEALSTLDWSRHKRLVVDDDDPRRMCRIPTKGDSRHGSVDFAKTRRACASSMDSGKKRLIDVYSNLRGFEQRCGSLRSGWQTGSVFSFSLNPSSTAPSLMRLRPGPRQIISLHEFEKVLVAHSSSVWPRDVAPCSSVCHLANRQGLEGGCLAHEDLAT